MTNSKALVSSSQLFSQPMKNKIIYLISVVALLTACRKNQPLTVASAQQKANDSSDEPIHYKEEKHFKNVRQLTFGGNNAEAYWNFAGTHLIFQSDNKNWTAGCDQIFVLDTKVQPDSSKRKLISTGKGRTTCSFFMPDDKSILYASTHLRMDTCPAVPVREGGRYVWPIYPEYDIFHADMNGNIIRQYTTEPGYDAEATVSPKGDKIIFTSTRSGDLDLWVMNIDGTGLKQITNSLGYDGGAAFSADGKKIVWRASRPKTLEEVKKYRELLDQHLVEPTNLEIFVADADGGNVKQITSLGKANWAPYFHPDGKRVLFCSNYQSAIGFPFNIFMINLDGTGLEQVTYDTQFDSFLMFSPDGKKVAWCSNRHNGRTRDTNVFIADWVN
jgi:Tol biopolymer transport system component